MASDSPGDRPAFVFLSCPSCGASPDSDLPVIRSKVGHGKLRGLPLSIVACRNCGFVRLNPSPTDETLGEYYRQDRARPLPPESAEPSSVVLPKPSAAQRMRSEWSLRWLEERIGRLTNQTILDIGAGERPEHPLMALRS